MNSSIVFCCAENKVYVKTHKKKGINVLLES